MTQCYTLYEKGKIILLNLSKTCSGATKYILAQFGHKGF